MDIFRFFVIEPTIDEHSNCCIAVLMDSGHDVNFIFGCDSAIVTIPAHKRILAASSPVFDAMFHGDLKESGDVKIVDACPSTFKEFLHFFYDSPVNVTMNNVFCLLMLFDKYDVASALPICADFLKHNLTSDNLLWILNVALKFHLDNLKSHCTDQIRKNLTKVLGMFDVDDNGRITLNSNSSYRLKDSELGRLFAHVYRVVKNSDIEVTDMESTNGPLISIGIASRYLSRYDTLGESQSFIFEVAGGSLLLTEIVWSNVFTFDEETEQFHAIQSKFLLSIQEDSDSSSPTAWPLFAGDFEIDKDGENRFKLRSGLLIKSGVRYKIKTRIVPYLPRIYSYRANLHNIVTVPLARGIEITFLQLSICCLLSALHFTRLKDPEQ